MNLADIRKKADDNKNLAAVQPRGAAVASVQCPEMEDSDFLAFEEPAFDEFEMPEKNLPAKPCIDNAQSTEYAVPVSEPVVHSNDHSADSPQVAAVTETAEKEKCQSIISVPEPATKRAVGYNPIETILSGRESAAASEEYSDSRADSYVTDEVEEYLCFRVAHEEYAISIMAIKEIIKPRDVTEVPRMPSFISGVISLRGVIIPVMDMRQRLSLPVFATAGKERIIVVKHDSGFCGVLVDEVIQVARIRKNDLEEPPAVLDGIDRDFVTGLGHFDNRMLILLNLATILDISVH